MTILSELKLIADTFTFIEGPTWHKDGYLLFSDIPESKIYRFDEEEGVSLWRLETGQSNGLAFDRMGNLMACEHANRRVSMTDLNGSIIPVAEQYNGHRLNSPNDCIVRSDGVIYFTDPPYGIEEHQKEQSFNGVFRVTLGEAPVLLSKDFDKPNGLALSLDETQIYIADTEKELVRIYQVATNGDISDGRVIAHVGRPDGMKVDVNGCLYVASTEGMVVFDPDGTRIESMQLPQRPANMAFGGDDYKTLFIAARTGLYQLRSVTPGITIWR
jgi:gluconolactonase